MAKDLDVQILEIVKNNKLSPAKKSTKIITLIQNMEGDEIFVVRFKHNSPITSKEIDNVNLLHLAIFYNLKKLISYLMQQCSDLALAPDNHDNKPQDWAKDKSNILLQLQPINLSLLKRDSARTTSSKPSLNTLTTNFPALPFALNRVTDEQIESPDSSDSSSSFSPGSPASDDSALNYDIAPCFSRSSVAVSPTKSISLNTTERRTLLTLGVSPPDLEQSPLYRRSSLPTLFRSKRVSIHLPKTPRPNGNDLEQIIEAGDIEALREYLRSNDTLDSETGITALIQCLKLMTNENQKNEVEYLLVFNLLLSHINITSSDQFINWLQSNPDKNQQQKIIALIINSLQSLGTTTTLSHKKWLNQFSTLNKEFFITLSIINGWNKSQYDEAKPFPFTQTPESSLADYTLEKMIWDSCITLPLMSPAEDNSIAERTAGLISFTTQENILTILIKLYDEFNCHQKLIANLIIMQMLLLDSDNTLPNTPSFLLSLESFKRKNLEFFPNNGQALNEVFDSVIKLKKVIQNNAICNNYRSLQNWFMTDLNNISQLSFAEMIETALNNPSEEKSYIKKIANELHALTICTLQNISIKEFYNKAWSSEEKMLLSPGICRSIQTTNFTVNYLIECILRLKDIEKISTCIQLLILVARHLCQPRVNAGPNLAAIMIIISALNSYQIDRLKDSLNLSDETKEIWAQLNQLISNAHNNKWQRMCLTLYHDAVPHLGLFLTDITYCYDGNQPDPGHLEDYDSRSVNLLDELGKQLHKIHQLHTELLFVSAITVTNIFTEIQSLPEQKENKLELLTWQIKPPILIIADMTLHDLNNQLGYLLANKIIPRVSYDGTTYENKEALLAIHDYLLSIYKESTLPQCGTYFGSINDGEASDSSSAVTNKLSGVKTIKKIRQLLIELVELINSKNQQEKINPIFFSGLKITKTSQNKEPPALNHAAACRTA